MNKIWNATRFALGGLEDFRASEFTDKSIPSKKDLSIFDQWILDKLGQTMTTLDEALEQDRFSDAANAIYSFIWYDFCDWYIEFVKPILNGPKGPERTATQLTMALVLNRTMRLLHPFAPFITEELYQKLPLRGQACIIDEYPNLRNDAELMELVSSTATFEIDLTKSVIAAIRNIRGENRISPALKINVRLAPNEDMAQKILSGNRTAICTLGRVENLEISVEGSMSKCAVTPVTLGSSQVQVIVPLQGLVDIEEEVKRIEKALEKLDKDISGLSSRLNNANFVKNASEEVIEADRKLFEQSKSQRDSLQAGLVRLRS